MSAMNSLRDASCLLLTCSKCSLGTCRRSLLFSPSVFLAQAQGIRMAATQNGGSGDAGHHSQKDGGSSKKTLTLDTMNPHIKVMEYAVRGPLVIRAGEIEAMLKKVRKYNTGLQPTLSRIFLSCRRWTNRYPSPKSFERTSVIVTLWDKFHYLYPSGMREL